jgi:hypothetical protein
MKRRLIATAVTLTAAGAVALAAPTAASAATTIHPHVSASLAKPVIHSGTKTTLAGSVTPGAAGRLVALQRYWSRTWHTMSTHKLSSSSHYSFSVGPTARGVYPYRVYRYAQTGRTSAVSRTVNLTVQTKGWITTRTYTGSGDWQGPTIHIGVTDYRLAYRYSCNDSSPFLSVAWQNANLDFFEYLWSEPANGYSASGTWYGHSGGRYGYFDVGSQDDCSWSFSVQYYGWH